jgi:hypothetical protein
MAKGLEDYLNGKTDRDMRAGRLTRLFQNLRGILTRHKG